MKYWCWHSLSEFRNSLQDHRIKDLFSQKIMGSVNNNFFFFFNSVLCTYLLWFLTKDNYVNIFCFIVQSFLNFNNYSNNLDSVCLCSSFFCFFFKFSFAFVSILCKTCIIIFSLKIPVTTRYLTSRSPVL